MNGGPASSALWEMALAVLCEQGHKEPSARAFVGKCLKAWDEEYVREAVLAALGKTDSKAYMKAVLSKKPPKKPRPSVQAALIAEQEPPAAPEVARAKIAQAKALLRK